MKKNKGCAESHFRETCAIAIQYYIPSFLLPSEFSPGHVVNIKKTKQKWQGRDEYRPFCHHFIFIRRIAFTTPFYQTTRNTTPTRRAFLSIPPPPLYLYLMPRFFIILRWDVGREGHKLRMAQGTSPSGVNPARRRRPRAASLSKTKKANSCGEDPTKEQWASHRWPGHNNSVMKDYELSRVVSAFWRLLFLSPPFEHHHSNS